MTFIFYFVRNILSLLGLFEVGPSIFGPVFMSVDSPLNRGTLLVKKAVLQYFILWFMFPCESSSFEGPISLCERDSLPLTLAFSQKLANTEHQSCVKEN